MDSDEKQHAKKHGELELRSAMQTAFPQGTRADRDAAIWLLRGGNRKAGGA